MTWMPRAIEAWFAVTTPLAGSLLYICMSPKNQMWGPVLSRGNPASGGYALTFDDGPTPGATDLILDLLREMKAPSTFFVIGQNAARFPELLKRIHAEGHLVANHSYDHPHYGMFRSPQYWRDQVDRTNRLLAELIGEQPSYFRPPLGIKTPAIHGAAQRAGQQMVNWNRRALDGLDTTPERILQRLLPAQAGDILLLHDGRDPHRRPRQIKPTLEALATLIDNLRQRQLEPMRLDQLLASAD